MCVLPSDCTAPNYTALHHPCIQVLLKSTCDLGKKSHSEVVQWLPYTFSGPGLTNVTAMLARAVGACSKLHIHIQSIFLYHAMTTPPDELRMSVSTITLPRAHLPYHACGPSDQDGALQPNLRVTTSQNLPHTRPKPALKPFGTDVFSTCPLIPATLVKLLSFRPCHPQYLHLHDSRSPLMFIHNSAPY